MNIEEDIFGRKYYENLHERHLYANRMAWIWSLGIGCLVVLLDIFFLKDALLFSSGILVGISLFLIFYYYYFFPYWRKLIKERLIQIRKKVKEITK